MPHEGRRRSLTVLPLDESLDTFTAARLAKVNQATMRRWCEEGRIAACKPGGRWRIDRASLYALIEAGQNRKQGGDLDAALAALRTSSEHLNRAILNGCDEAIEAAYKAIRKAIIEAAQNLKK